MELKWLAYVHKALCEPVRFEIFIIIKNSKSKISYSSILDKLHISQPTLSFHLKELLKNKLINLIKAGKNNFYQHNKETESKIWDVMFNAVKKGLKYKKTTFTNAETLSTFELFSDENRLLIASIVLNNPFISGKEIAITSKLDFPTVSFHIKKLIEGDLLCQRKIGNQNYYWVNVAFTNAFHEFIAGKHK